MIEEGFFFFVMMNVSATASVSDVGWGGGFEGSPPPIFVIHVCVCWRLFSAALLYSSSDMSKVTAML